MSAPPDGRRVVVTGMAGVSPVGSSWDEVRGALQSGRSGLVAWPPLEAVAGLRTRVAGPAAMPDLPAQAPRKKLRGMGRVARLATWTTLRALEDAGLAGEPVVSDGRTGLAYGSTSGSPDAIVAFSRAFVLEQRVKGLVPMQYVKAMSHTCAANLAQFFEIRGVVLPTNSACTSGSQAIGAGYEQIRFGRQEVMVCGGAEELHETEVGVFDLMFATSTRNDEPASACRPFDVERDGLVVGEGAATLVLESEDHARGRGAEILAHVIGYGTNCDGLHLMAPDPAGMQGAMQRALDDAQLEAGRVDYVCAHATATEAGDIAESAATRRTYGRAVPTSSLKGHLGHTLGACGALEAWMTIGMLREGWMAPTLNLERVDPRCAALDYVTGGPRNAGLEIAASNNFAFGGINTSLLFRRPR